MKSELYVLNDDLINSTCGRKTVDVRKQSLKFCKALLKAGFNAEEEVTVGEGYLQATIKRLPTFTCYYDLPLLTTRVMFRISLRGKDEVNFFIYNQRLTCTEIMFEDDIASMVNQCNELNGSLHAVDYLNNPQGLSSNPIISRESLESDFNMAWITFCQEISWSYDYRFKEQLEIEQQRFENLQKNLDREFPPHPRY